MILTSTESSDSSYYGEQGLHYISTNGDSCLVPLGVYVITLWTWLFCPVPRIKPFLKSGISQGLSLRNWIYMSVTVV